MKSGFVKNTIGILIGSNLYIAFIAAIVALPLLWPQRKFESIIFVFFATQLSYNLQRYLKWSRKKNAGFLNGFIPQNNSGWLLLLGINFAFFVLSGMHFNQEQLFVIGLAGGISGAYLFIYPIKNKLTGLRYIPFLKTIIVSCTWTILLIGVSYQEAHFAEFNNNYLYWTIVFGQVWIACLLFDVRDREIDRGDVTTFANALSPLLFQLFWMISTIAVFILEIMFSSNLMLITIGIQLIVSTLQYWCIAKKREEMLFTFIADGTLILSALMNYLLLKFH